MHFILKLQKSLYPAFKAYNIWSMVYRAYSPWSVVVCGFQTDPSISIRDARVYTITNRVHVYKLHYGVHEYGAMAKLGAEKLQIYCS